MSDDDEGYELSSHDNILPLRVMAVTASLMVLASLQDDPVPCVFVELGDQGTDEASCRLVLSRAEARAVALGLATCANELDALDARLESESAAFRKELDG